MNDNLIIKMSNIKELKMKLYKSLLYILQLSICTLLLQPATVLAKTTRSTTVHVQNLTGLDIESVSVVHKYSNVFREKTDWGKLSNGKMTRQFMKIRYNTGALTTGQDWWLVTWKYKRNNSVLYTAPNNFRGIVDMVERMHLLPYEAVNTSMRQVPGFQLLSITPTARLANGLMNSGSTKGLKKHLLRKSDQANGVIITIRHDSVAFDSASGHSSTKGIHTRYLPPPTTTQQ